MKVESIAECSLGANFGLLFVWPFKTSFTVDCIIVVNTTNPDHTASESIVFVSKLKLESI